MAGAETEQDSGIHVADVEKNSRGEIIRIRLTEFKNTELCDIRLWYEASDSQEKRPTSKGFSVRRTLLRPLIEALEKAESMCEPTD